MGVIYSFRKSAFLIGVGADLGVPPHSGRGMFLIVETAISSLAEQSPHKLLLAPLPRISTSRASANCVRADVMEYSRDGETERTTETATKPNEHNHGEGEGQREIESDGEGGREKERERSCNIHQAKAGERERERHTHTHREGQKETKHLLHPVTT